LYNSTPDSSALGEQMREATKIKRHQDDKKTGTKRHWRTWYTWS